MYKPGSGTGGGYCETYGNCYGQGGSEYDGGGGEVPPADSTKINEDPCGTVLQKNDEAYAISENAEFKQKKATATAGVANNIPEKGYVFGKDIYGNPKTGNVKTGNEDAVHLPATDPNFTVTGSLHTHPGDNCLDSFSPLDFYAMGNSHQTNSSFSLMFICIFRSRVQFGHY